MSKIILTLAILLVLYSFSYAQQEESITITTYYPSPYGSYRELTAHRMKIGRTYSDVATTVADDNLIVEGNVGIGTTNPIAKLHVAGGNLDVGQDMTAGVISIQYAGGRGIITPMDNSIGVTDLWLQTRNVGIGTSSPQARLDVNGDINFNGQKMCSGVRSGNYRDTITVPASWTRPMCWDWANSISIITWQVGCIFTDGHSWGPSNDVSDHSGSPPSRNCGW